MLLFVCFVGGFFLLFLLILIIMSKYWEDIIWPSKRSIALNKAVFFLSKRTEIFLISPQCVVEHIQSAA